MGGGEEYTGEPHQIQDDLLNNEEFIHQESGSPTEGRSMPFSPVNISPSEARTIDNQTEGQPHLLQANNFSEDKYRQNVHDTVEKVQKGSVREIMSIYIQEAMAVLVWSELDGNSKRSVMDWARLSPLCWPAPPRPHWTTLFSRRRQWRSFWRASTPSPTVGTSSRPAIF